MDAFLGLSLAAILGWMVWAILAFLTVYGSLVVITWGIDEGLGPGKKSGRKDYWNDPDFWENLDDLLSMAITCLFWWAILVFFLPEDWAKLHLLWVAPLSVYLAVKLGNGIAYIIKRSLRKDLESLERAFQSIVESVWRPSLSEGKLLEEVRLRCAVEGIPFSPSKLSKSLELGRQEIGRILRVCEQDLSPEGSRDAAIMVLLHAYGLARGQIVSLTMEDYIAESETLLVRSPPVWLRTLRKVDARQIERAGPLTISTNGLTDWMQADDPGWFICQIGPDGRVLPDGAITASKIYQVLKTRVEQAGLHSRHKRTSFQTMGTTRSWSPGRDPALALQCPFCLSYSNPSVARSCNCFDSS